LLIIDQCCLVTNSCVACQEPCSSVGTSWCV